VKVIHDNALRDKDRQFAIAIRTHGPTGVTRQLALPNVLADSIRSPRSSNEDWNVLPYTGTSSCGLATVFVAVWKEACALRVVHVYTYMNHQTTSTAKTTLLPNRKGSLALASAATECRLRIELGIDNDGDNNRHAPC